MTFPTPWNQPDKPVQQHADAAITTWSQRGSSEVVVVPTQGVLPGQNLRSVDAWRALLHQITPVIVVALVTFGLATDNQAALWVPIAFAVLDPLLSVANSTDKLRRIVYGLAGLLQVGGLSVGLVTGLAGEIGGVIAPVAGATLTVLSSFLARFFTPTPTLVPDPALYVRK